jgi:hypothetical protein
VPKCTLSRTMAKREQIPPLLACPCGVPTSSRAHAALSRNMDGKGFSVRRRETRQRAFVLIALKISLRMKASIGLSTESCVAGVDYMASHEERTSFSCRDISSYVLLVPIRDDSEMVLDLELCVAEAGLRRLGVAV